ncbi:hypothetical protein GCM10027162_47340 [Streptomyces incanus]
MADGASTYRRYGRETNVLDPPDSPNFFTMFTSAPQVLRPAAGTCPVGHRRDRSRGMPSARPMPSSVKETGTGRALPRRTLGQAEQEVVLQVELEVEVELVLVQPASTTSLASE